LSPVPFALAGTILALALPLLLDGVERKIRAGIHSRIGPPVTQTILDFLKLYSKETRVTRTVLVFTYLGLTSLITVAAGLFAEAMYLATLDEEYLLYTMVLYLISQATATLSFLILPNPYSIIGGFREVLVSLVNEPFLLLGLILYTRFLSVINHSPLGFLGLAGSTGIVLVASYVSTRRVPFDLAEAEPELASGVLIELTGRVLLLALYMLLALRAFSQLIPLVLLAPWLGGGWVPALIAYTAWLPLTWAVYATVSNIMGRSRVDLAVKRLAEIYLILLAPVVVGVLGGL
jgi:formate hydrogenlyase subunit 4